MSTAKRNSQRKFHPRLLKSRMAEIARMTPADTDEVLIKGGAHGFSKLDHFSPDAVEQRIQQFLNGRKTERARKRKPGGLAGLSPGEKQPHEKLTTASTISK